jgi:hypothetical protein
LLSSAVRGLASLQGRRGYAAGVNHSCYCRTCCRKCPCSGQGAGCYTGTCWCCCCGRRTYCARHHSGHTPRQRYSAASWRSNYCHRRRHPHRRIRPERHLAHARRRQSWLGLRSRSCSDTVNDGHSPHRGACRGRHTAGLLISPRGSTTGVSTSTTVAGHGLGLSLDLPHIFRLGPPVPKSMWC